MEARPPWASKRRSRSPAHLEHVLHPDDAALQDGGAHRGDLDGAAVPRLPGAGAHDVSAQRAHHCTLLLLGAAGDEGLRLDDVGPGNHRAGGGVVELGEHGYHLACVGERGRRLEGLLFESVRDGKSFIVR